MEKWQVITKFISSSTDEFHKASVPGFEDSKLPFYSLDALQYHLNKYGEDGWEIVSVEPVLKGDNDDVLLHAFAGTKNGSWSHWYLCVLKRQVQP